MSVTEMSARTHGGSGEQVPWQGVLEALDEVVLLLNGQYVVAYASPSVRPRLGYAPHEITGQALGDLVHPDDLRAALRNLSELPGLGVVRQSVRVRRRGRRLRVAGVDAHPDAERRRRRRPDRAVGA